MDWCFIEYLQQQVGMHVGLDKINSRVFKCYKVFGYELLCWRSLAQRTNLYQATEATLTSEINPVYFSPSWKNAE